MGYVVRLTPQAASDLADYIASFSHDASLQRRITDIIEAALQRLAANPKVGVTPRHPLGRPTYMVEFKVDDVVRYLRVVYRYSEDEAALEVLTVRRVIF